MAAVIIYREPLPDGTMRVWERQDDGSTTSFVVGTPRNRAQEAQASLDPYREMYADPFYQEFVLGPMNAATARQTAMEDRTFGLQERGVDLQERIGEANIALGRDTLEQRKHEYRLAHELQQRGQSMQANLALAQMRGAGNAAQFIDASRRLRGFGTETGALAQIAGGGMPTGNFGTGWGQNPVSLQDRMSGMLGASPDQIDARDRNDRALAGQIERSPGQLMRGSIESMPTYEREYMSSYMLEPEQFMENYQRAGIHQGRTVRG